MTHAIPVNVNTIQEILKRLEKLSRDVEEIKAHRIENIPMIDEKANKRIGESLKAYKEGKYTILKNDGDIKKFIENL